MKKFVIMLFSIIILTVGVNAQFKRVNTYNGNFDDVASTAWYAENVKSAYELGFMQGKSEGVFDPNGNVTFAEGLTIASRLHAQYNGTVVTPRKTEEYEHRIDFDAPSFLVDLTKRNARNDNGVNFYRSNGEIRDGMIVFQPDAPNAQGNYDPGILIEGLDLDARNYNKITFRMKRDELPNIKPDAKRNETVEIYFKTSTEPSIQANKCVKVSLEEIDDLTDWFEVEVDVTHYKWKNFIRGIRFDPTNNNGIYYVDYIVFSKSENSDDGYWYEMYYDYAVDNGIIGKHEYTLDRMNEYISRQDLCKLFASALPEEYFTPINDVKGIPDISPDDVEAEVLRTLYKAGIILGSDEQGTFNGASNVKRSEISAIINRIAIPENRVRGNISADWSSMRNEADIEFDDNYLLGKISHESKHIDISDGKIYLEALQRANGRYDPKIIFNNLAINAYDYSKIRIRIKTEFEEPVKMNKVQLFFMTDSDSGFTEQKAASCNYAVADNADSFGWHIIEIDLRLNPQWNGNISSVRLDPGDNAGTYIIDYIRFVGDDYYKLSTHDELIEAGYTATRLLRDEGFERGFYVSKFDQTNTAPNDRIFNDYSETDEKPLWHIAPWHTKHDLWENRDPSNDKYTLSDTYGINEIKYNPEEKSISMRLNATNVYKGQPYVYSPGNWWAHQLLEQNTALCPIDKKRNSAAADRMFAEIDIRMTDFKNTTNTEGTNACSFLVYFYLMTDKAPGQRIWFGLNMISNLNATGASTPGWSPDSSAHQYMYKIPEALVYNGIENSFNPAPGVAAVSDEWKKVRIDVTPHIEQAVEWANRDNIFGVPVTAEDMFFSGVNIGFEIWGNYDCTFEFKNFNMVSYNKAAD